MKYAVMKYSLKVIAMRDEKEIREAIENIRNFINTAVARGLMTEEGRKTWLDRMRVLRWVLEEQVD